MLTRSLVRILCMSCSFSFLCMVGGYLYFCHAVLIILLVCIYVCIYVCQGICIVWSYSMTINHSYIHDLFLKLILNTGSRYLSYNSVTARISLIYKAIQGIGGNNLHFIQNIALHLNSYRSITLDIGRPDGHTVNRHRGNGLDQRHRASPSNQEGQLIPRRLREPCSRWSTMRDRRSKDTWASGGLRAVTMPNTRATGYIWRKLAYFWIKDRRNQGQKEKG
jgi:hypothetical protein